MNTLSLNGVFDLLADDRRRYVWEYLSGRSGNRIPLDELTDQVSSDESAVGTTASVDARRAIRVSLHHVHLPKLADAGLLEYDTRSNVVHYHTVPTPEQVVADVGNGSADVAVRSLCDD